MPYRCLNCGFTSAGTDFACDAPGCGFKVGRFEYEDEHDTSSGPPSTPTETAWNSLIAGPFLVFLFGLVAYGVIRIGVPVIFVVIGFFSSSKVNWDAVNEFTSWAAIVGAIGAMFWLVHLELGGMSGIRTYFAEAPENAAHLIRRLAQLLLGAAVAGGVLYVLYQVIKSAFLK